MQSKAVLVVLLILALVAVPAMAVSQKAAEKGINGKGNADHLYLFEKDPSGDWPIIDGGAWGKLNFNLKTDKFVFNGHGLAGGEDYTLLGYKEPWPGIDSVVLGSGTADEFGNVHISGVMETLPVNTYTNEDGTTYTGSKVWLVISEDFDGTQFTAWNPTEYLFEYQLIKEST